MSLYVAGLTQRSKVAGVKSPRLHIKRPPCTLLNRAYMVYVCGYGRQPLFFTILANGVHG